MTTRAAIRAELKTLLETLTDFVQVSDHESFDFQRMSPVAMILNDGTRPGPAISFSSRNHTHAMIIQIWWKREDTTETLFDALTESVFALMEANSNANAAWNSLELDNNFSTIAYPVVEGIQYAVEQIRVLVW